MISYKEIIPVDVLKPFISVYWILETDGMYQPASQRIFPNGCVDLWINIGNTTPGLNGTPLKPGVIYLGGTLISAGIVESIPNSNFIGVRFKPGGFSAFYNLPLHEVTGQILEFSERDLLSILDIDDHVSDRLNSFFSSKVRSLKSIIAITETIENLKGNVKVDRLADKHSVSNRTLERLFKEHTGVPPKEFIKVIRFQHVLKRLRKNKPTTKLSHLAYEMGYYDHAHLTNEVKRYSGLNPSELALKFTNNG